MFKPDFSIFAGTGWFKVFAMAGGQMFFSLSLASGALVAYGSYMKKDADLEQNAMLVPVLDTFAALLAGLARVLNKKNSRYPPNTFTVKIIF